MRNSSGFTHTRTISNTERLSLSTTNLVSVGLVRKLSERSGMGGDDLNRSINSVPAAQGSVTPQGGGEAEDSNPESFLQFGSEEDITRNIRVHKQSNKIRTTRYTILSWAPLSLLLQFRRVANIYFLIISVLTLQEFSPKSPASMIGTFSFVLFLTMVKEAFEDYYRYK